MDDQPIRRALISVFDKSGVVEFARALSDRFGVQIISTGGTARLLEEQGIGVTRVEDVTGSGEMLDGRVKTLHPIIHAAILANRDNPDHMRQLKGRGIEPIDMVVVNLYPFEQTISDPDCSFDQAIEMIDIGGPCMLRAAAKNHKHVWVVSDPSRYEQVLAILEGGTAEAPAAALRRQFARDVFAKTFDYDSHIAAWLGRGTTSVQTELFARAAALRYGENPHQQGVFCHRGVTESATSLTPIKDADAEGSMSFNNYVDASAALELCRELSRAAPALVADRSSARTPCATVFIKHTNACGAAVDADPVESYRKAYLGDPNAAMGGILAVSRPVDRTIAERVMDTYGRWGKAAGAGGFFVEVWLAPSFTEDARELIRSAKAWGKRVRLIAVGALAGDAMDGGEEIKTITGGVLLQSRDEVGLDEGQWKFVTKARPKSSAMNDLRLAWLIAKHTKSNAISICKDGMLIGNGAGQMSRVMSCRIATWSAKENGHAERLAGAAAGSDAFFPFDDGPRILMEAGVSAIIQPGGSKRDDATIAACDDGGASMVLTGTRHFKH